MKKTSAIATETIDVPPHFMSKLVLGQIITLGAFPAKKKAQIVAVLTATNQIKVRPLSN